MLGSNTSNILIQKILKTKIQLKLEFVLWLVNIQLEKSHGRIFLYMITAVRLLYAQKWKDWYIQNGGMVGEHNRTKINLFA